MSADPLVVEFEVDVSPAHAFEIWTARCASWWPRSHTVSGDPARITFEPRAGGAILEHATDGDTHRWGEILDWEPPTRVRYLWHLFFDPSEATEVEVTFSQTDNGAAVRLEQRGFERLGDPGQKRRDRTVHAWNMIVPTFIEASREYGAGPV
jgi:uncharacterized protein YndB with AHSA1/START domain